MRTITKLLCVAALSVFGGGISAFAQEGETDVTTLESSWVNKGQGWYTNFNKADAETVFGTDASGSVNISYLDISAYSTLKLYGDEGQTARLFINMEDYPNTPDKGKFLDITIGAEGYATFDLSKVLTQQPLASHIHLNGVKAVWGQKLNLSRITISGDPLSLAMPHTFLAGETDLTLLPWVNEAQGCANELGKSTGDPIYGTHDGPSGENLSYVDVTAYDYIHVYGPASQTVRFFINRKEYPSNFTFTVTTNADGIGILDIKDVYAQQSGATYVHINGIKGNYSNAQIDYLAAFAFPDGETDLTELTYIGGCTKNFGVNTKSTIYGTDAVPASAETSYVDVTDYGFVNIYGTANETVRLFINRYENDAYDEYAVTLDATGKGTLNLYNVFYDSRTTRSYIHINGVKGLFDTNTFVSHLSVEGTAFVKPTAETDLTTLAWTNQTGGAASNFWTSTGATIYGTDAGPSGSALSYVDITGYDVLKVYGTAGDVVRAFINRAEYPSGKFTFWIQIDENGVGTLNLADVYAAQAGATYIHLNGIKTAQSWQGDIIDADGKALVKYLSVAKTTSISSSLISTFGNSTSPTWFSTSVKPYTAKYQDGNLVFAEITSKEVPANTGVLLVADEAGTYNYTTIASTDETATSDLKVSTGIVTMEEGKNYYVLAMKTGDEKPAFYKVAGSGSFELAAGKCYLEIASGEARESFSIFFEDGAPAGISTVENSDGKAQTSHTFNLAGQRVGNDYKGMVIKNGKKYIIK